MTVVITERASVRVRACVCVCVCVSRTEDGQGGYSSPPSDTNAQLVRRWADGLIVLCCEPAVRRVCAGPRLVGGVVSAQGINRLMGD